MKFEIEIPKELEYHFRQALDTQDSFAKVYSKFQKDREDMDIWSAQVMSKDMISGLGTTTKFMWWCILCVRNPELLDGYIRHIGKLNNAATQHEQKAKDVDQ